MELTVKACESAEETAAAIRACEVAFGWEVSEKDMEQWLRIFEPERVFGVYAHDLLVGAGANHSFELTIPGGSVPTAGVTLIGVKPSHRRRGALKKIIAALHADAMERREPLAVLWASESNIYQRFGYGIGTMAMLLDAERDRMEFVDDSAPAGQMRQVDHDEALKLLPQIYEEVCARTPGMYKRSETWWSSHVLYDPEQFRDGGAAFIFVLEAEGRPAGYVIYRIKNEWDLTFNSSMNLIEFMGVDPAAEKELWRFITGVDLVSRIKAYRQPVDYPAQLWMTEPRRLGARVAEALFVRILALEAALTARTYAAPGKIVLEIADALHPANAGRWQLDATGDRPEVRAATDSPADVSLDIRDLAATYLGAFSLSDLLAAGRGSSADHDATRLFDDMFRTARKPWCPEVF